MYIRKTKRAYKGKTYTNHLLVESVLTPKGPRQRTICSLGSLEPAPHEEWLALAHKLKSALQGQLSLSGWQAPMAPLLARARKGRRQRREPATIRRPAGSLVVIDTERVDTEEHREAGTVHVWSTHPATIACRFNRKWELGNHADKMSFPGSESIQNGMSVA